MSSRRCRWYSAYRRSLGRRDVGLAIDADPQINTDGNALSFAIRAHQGLCYDRYVFLHDRVTNITVPLNYERPNFAPGTFVSRPAIDGRGGFVAFREITQIPGPVVFDVDLVVRGCDSSDTANDVSGNGRLGETVLQVLDTSSGEIQTLCPAGAVSIAEGMAALLRPEAAGEAVGCPAGSSVTAGSSFNDDDDASDEVVHLWRAGTPAENLHCAATAIALSATHLAALVPEAGQGNGSLNRDDDIEDSVVKVYALSDPAPESCSQWTEVGATIRFLTREAEQGQDLNGNRTKEDLVLQTFNVRVAERLLDVGGSAGHAAGQQLAPSSSVATVAAISAGVCAGSGQPCAIQADCGADDVCFVPPGGCVHARDLSCNPGRASHVR